MSAAVYNLQLEQGVTFWKTLVFRDGNGDLIDLTDYLIRGQIRKTAASPVIVASFDLNIIGLGTVT